VNEERLGSPTQFAQAVVGHIEDVKQGTLPVPSAADFERLIELMFFASLQASYPWQVTLVYTPPRRN
jgi:hypothetical protein